MFANLMNVKEKECFLELIYKIANIDNEYSEEEEKLINNYKIELGLDIIPETASVEELLIFFSEKSEQMRKIVLFELYGMIMADDKIDEKEKEIIVMIQKKFWFDEKTMNSIISVAKELQNVYDKIYKVLF